MEREISRGQKIGREVIKVVYYPVTRSTEVDAANGGLQRAEQLHREGNGILVAITHFSRRDPMTAMGSLMHNREFGNDRFTAPIAHHHNYFNLSTITGHFTGVNMRDIVTPETIRRATSKGGPKGLKQGDGLRQYLSDAADTLSSGGIVVVAPQATRVPTLSYKINEEGQEEGSDTLKGLVRVAQRKTSNFGIHLMAFEIPGVDDYSKVKGFNFFRKYKVLHGPTFTLEEALQESSLLAPDPSARNSATDHIDQFVMNEFEGFVPEAYRSKR